MCFLGEVTERTGGEGSRPPALSVVTDVEMIEYVCELARFDQSGNERKHGQTHHFEYSFAVLV